MDLSERSRWWTKRLWKFNLNFGKSPSRVSLQLGPRQHISWIILGRLFLEDCSTLYDSSNDIHKLCFSLLGFHILEWWCQKDWAPICIRWPKLEKSLKLSNFGRRDHWLPTLLDIWNLPIGDEWSEIFPSRPIQLVRCGITSDSYFRSFKRLFQQLRWLWRTNTKQYSCFRSILTVHENILLVQTVHWSIILHAPDTWNNPRHKAYHHNSSCDPDNVLFCQLYHQKGPRKGCRL